ncbi:MAG: zinc metallopeptidase [Oscillospiraceae bacterium]|jgi:Zn-dependent membrane protease YugP|nr:zinc metallopeptidase [Oscillospiraceae bacterium]
MLGYYEYGPLYWASFIAFALCLVAEIGVKTTFSRYDKIKGRSGATGADVAMALLRAGGIIDVKVERISKNLGDHFDHTAGVIRLSEKVYNGSSVAALGVAAHEVGHALQYKEGYLPIKLRNEIYPVVAFGSSAAIPLFFLGMILSLSGLALAGIILFGFVAVFQFVTLPTEINASNRALDVLKTAKILDEDEIGMASRVLRAAAFTYVASLVMTLVNLLRFIYTFRRRD